ncbi:FAD-dependent monooxygenase [Streptomyces reniochalinae]|uniref:FAD-binding domain-containing protein n=1 Tax=Streptomyces reniochalinae TaxID=2250578 RepID=A0A367E6B7_9ACTN|nr:FAD-dependent monooxygenase [Streptomyces reniochalinae]RCG13606.1 hypothetical protein DQ392_31810 [Streptomyces reniochalinae]
MSPIVAVAGAGPVGLMLAGELSAAGVRTVVLEQRDEPRTTSPGMAINPTVVELLTQRGVMEALRGEGMELPQAFFAHLPLDPAKLPEQRAYNFMVAQTRLEHRLEERAVEAGADIRRGHQITGVAQDEESDGVRVRVRADGAERTLHCRYLVGCDGEASTVREAAGIAFPGRETPFYGIVGDFDLTDELFGRLGAHQYADGLFTVAPTSPSTLRVTVGEFGVRPPDPDAPATVEELRRLARRITGDDVTLDKPHWLDRWFNRARQADSYRSGSVFLAGDAAHIQFPLGGLALSTGIEDAVNLGWKLAADVRGRAPAGLLDTYESERRPVGARTCAVTGAQAALMQPGDRAAPVRELLRELIEYDDVNAHLVRAVGGLDSRYPLGSADEDSQGSQDGEDGGPGAHALTGQRPGDIPLRTADGEETSLARLLLPGHGVLLAPTGAVSESADVTGWQDRVDVVVAEPTERIGARTVLLRPDGRVAWAADGGDADADRTGLRAALERWFGPAAG